MKPKKNNQGFGSYSMYGHFGNYGKKNKISLPTLGHIKK